MYIRKISIEIPEPYAENLIRLFEIVRKNLYCIRENTDHAEAMIALCSFHCAEEADRPDHAVVFADTVMPLLEEGASTVFSRSDAIGIEFKKSKIAFAVVRRHGLLYLELMYPQGILKSLVIERVLMMAERQGIRFSAYVTSKETTPILRDRVVQHLFERSCEMLDRVHRAQGEFGCLREGYAALLRAAREEKEFFMELE